MSLKRRTFVRIMILLSLTVVAVCFSMSAFSVMQNREHERSLAQTQALLAASQAQKLISRDERAALKALLAEMVSSRSVIQYAFVERGGQPYVHTFEERVPEALLGGATPEAGAAVVRKLKNDQGRTFYDVAAPVGREGTALHLGISRKEIDRHVSAGVVTIAALGVVALLLSAVLAMEVASVTTREVTAMAETLRRSQQDMAQHEKMVALGTMAAGIAHEIGNPLACMSAVVQLLQRRGQSPEDGYYLRSLEEQVERIATIVRQVVEFARPASGLPDLADVDELTEEAVSMIRYSHSARYAQIESIRNRDLPRVRVVPQQFQQVLVNLLLNAFDAMAGLDNRRVIVERVHEDGWVHVRVKDRGHGMTEEEVRHAFEPFYTTKPLGEGTGLGLTVSYALLERQGGRIRIDSVPGQGTVVTVSFRAGQPMAGKPAAWQPSAAGERP